MRRIVGNPNLAVIVACGAIGVLLASTSHVTAQLVDVSFADLALGSTPASVVNHGTLGGTFDLVQDPARAVPYIGESLGVLGVAMNMDGNKQNAYVGPVAPASVIGAGLRTVEVWAYNPSMGREENVVSWGHRGSDGQNWACSYGQSESVSGKLFGGVGQWGDAADTPWTTNPLSGADDSLFHHLVFTYDGTTTRLYFDGVLDTEKDTPTDTFGGVDSFILGSSNAAEGVPSVTGQTSTGGTSFSGLINSVRIYDFVLDGDTILADYGLGPIVVPEPTTFALGGLGIAGLLILRRRRNA